MSVHAPRFFVIYDSQFPLASSRFGRDLIQYRVGKTHCQGHQDPSKRVSIFLRGTEANYKMVSIWPVSISRNRTVLDGLQCLMVLHGLPKVAGVQENPDMLDREARQSELVLFA